MEQVARVLAFVLAGGEGRRLAPLTAHVAKPAAPFLARHRLVDFALSNLCNSGLATIEVLLQHEPQTLLRHLRRTWSADRPDDDFRITTQVGGVGPMPAYRGTADAVRCRRDRILAFAPDVVAIFSADHVYRMDVREMLAFHLASGADVSVSSMPVPVAEAHAFGVIDVDGAGRIRRFEEKPARPAEIPGHPGTSLVSMGNYLFDPRVLLAALDATHAAGGVDFGRDLLPRLVRSHRLMAYDFATNRLATSRSRPYWRDVGTIDAYFAAHMDMVAEAPPFRLADARWPIRCRRAEGAPEGVPAVRSDATGEDVRVGLGAHLVDTVVRRGVEIGFGATLARCIVAEDVRVGARCRLGNAIVDAGNWLPDGLEAGFDPSSDARRWPVSPGGIVVIPRGAFPAPRFARVVPWGHHHASANAREESPMSHRAYVHPQPSNGASWAVRLTLLVATLAVAGTAQAQLRWGESAGGAQGYVGGAIGQAKFDPSCVPGLSCDNSRTAFKLVAGGAASEAFSAEIGYINMGRIDFAGGRQEAQGFNISLVGSLPFTPAFTAFGKVGTTYGWTDTDTSAPGVRTGSENGFGLSYGIGLGYKLTNQLEVTAEYERHKFEFAPGDQTIGLTSVGLRYRY